MNRKETELATVEAKLTEIFNLPLLSRKEKIWEFLRFIETNNIYLDCPCCGGGNWEWGDKPLRFPRDYEGKYPYFYYSFYGDCGNDYQSKCAFAPNGGDNIGSYLFFDKWGCNQLQLKFGEQDYIPIEDYFPEEDEEQDYDPTFM